MVFTNTHTESSYDVVGVLFSIIYFIRPGDGKRSLRGKKIIPFGENG